MWKIIVSVQNALHEGGTSELWEKSEERKKKHHSDRAHRSSQAILVATVDSCQIVSLEIARYLLVNRKHFPMRDNTLTRVRVLSLMLTLTGPPEAFACQKRRVHYVKDTSKKEGRHPAGKHDRKREKKEHKIHAHI